MLLRRAPSRTLVVAAVAAGRSGSVDGGSVVGGTITGTADEARVR